MLARCAGSLRLRFAFENHVWCGVHIVRSNFLTLIVGLFFAIGIDWAVQWGCVRVLSSRGRVMTHPLTSPFCCAACMCDVLVCRNSAMAEWVSTEEQMNMFLVWPPSKSRFNPYSRLTMNVFGLALIQLREVLTDSTCTPAMASVVPCWASWLPCLPVCADNLVFLDIVPPAIAGLAFLVWLGVLGGWIAMLFNFRRKVFRARQGIFDFDKRAVRITNVTKYMGYQAMHTLIAFFSIFVVAFVVILFIVLSIFVIPLQELEKQQLKEVRVCGWLCVGVSPIFGLQHAPDSVFVWVAGVHTLGRVPAALLGGVPFRSHRGRHSGGLQEWCAQSCTCRCGDSRRAMVSRPWPSLALVPSSRCL